MKTYHKDDKAVIALASMMTDEEVAEEFEILDRDEKELPFDEELCRTLTAAVERWGKEMGMTTEQFLDHLLAEGRAIADDDPDYYRKVAAILRLERAS